MWPLEGPFFLVRKRPLLALPALASPYIRVALVLTIRIVLVLTHIRVALPELPRRAACGRLPLQDRVRDLSPKVAHSRPAVSSDSTFLDRLAGFLAPRPG